MITAMYIGTALVLRMDMLMALFILLALRAFYRLYQGKASRSTRWMIPVYIFLAIFTKGPVGFLMPMVSIVAFLAIKKTSDISDATSDGDNGAYSSACASSGFRPSMPKAAVNTSTTSCSNKP